MTENDPWGQPVPGPYGQDDSPAGSPGWAGPPQPAGGWGSTPGAPAGPLAAQPYGAQPYGAQPYGAQPYGAQPYGAPPYGGYPQQWAPRPQTEGLAIASMVLAIAGFVTCFSGLIGLPMGIVARKRINRSGGALTGGGMALAGIILSGIQVAIILAYVVLFIVLGFTGGFEDASGALDSSY